MLPREDKISLETELSLLKEATLRAGELAVFHLGKDINVNYKDGDSPVTNIDLAVDDYLKKALLSARPSYGWISEETVDDRELEHKPEYYFVIDPIDGTRGLISGNNDWCISVALANSLGEPIVGVLYCPKLDKLYEAISGEGAFLNGFRLPSLPHKEFDSSLIFSCPPKLLSSLNLSPDDIKLSKDIPSLAYRIALLAEGEIDCVLVRPNCNDWDIIAVDLILKECGGKITDINGNNVEYMKPNAKHNLLLVARNSLISGLVDLFNIQKDRRL